MIKVEKKRWGFRNMCENLFAIIPSDRNTCTFKMLFLQHSVQNSFSKVCTVFAVSKHFEEGKVAFKESMKWLKK